MMTFSHLEAIGLFFLVFVSPFVLHVLFTIQDARIQRKVNRQLEVRS